MKIKLHMSNKEEYIIENEDFFDRFINSGFEEASWLNVKKVGFINPRQIVRIEKMED